MGKEYGFMVDGICYRKNSDGTTASVTEAGRKYSGSLVIPSSVTYGGKTYSVTSIGVSAFEGCSGLTSVTIPNSVKSIGIWAFLYTAWFDNQPDGVVYVGKVLYIYKGTMPENTSITIKEGTVSICTSAFGHCSGLANVEIPNSVTSIEDYAFEGCSRLTSVTIPNSVTRIGDSAFSYCSSLTSVEIPNSVTSIGRDAFEGCSLTNIRCKAEVPPLLTLSWLILFSWYDATLYVPKGSAEANRNTEGWKNFKKIVEWSRTKIIVYE